MKVYHHTFEDIISVENLLAAWREFLDGKTKKKDVIEFQYNLMFNILSLHEDLVQGLYRHGPYYEFKISDPKPRVIHKASVRDRLLHRAVYRKLYPFFDTTFIADSFSCRNNKGMHKALNRFRNLAHKVSQNNARTCWILKCDVKKFFASVNQTILIGMLSDRIADRRIMTLLQEIIGSFSAGLPLGNLTSQLFANIYLNKFDQFVKHGLKIRYYTRYADDLVIFSDSRQCLEDILPQLSLFFQENLKLQIHPDKVFIKTLASGMDFLGWVHFFDHRVLRTATKRRMFSRLQANPKPAVKYSYLGLLSHGNAKRLAFQI